MQIRSIRGRYFATLRRPDGGKHNINLFTRDEAEAKLIAKQGKLEEMEHAALAGGAALLAAVKYAGVTSAPVLEAIEEYLVALRLRGVAENTLMMTECYLNMWMTRTGLERRNVSDIEPKDIDTFINTSESVGYHTRTLRLEYLKRFFKYQAKKHRILHDPCIEIGVRKEGLSQKQMMKRVTHAFTDEEWQKLYAVAGKYGPFWKFLLAFGRDSALRFSDIVNMEIVNLERDHIRVSMRKTKREVRLPITPLMREVLDGVRIQFGTHLFPEEQRQLRINGNSTFRTTFKHIQRDAGVTMGSIRSLRKMGAMREREEANSEINRMIEKYSIERAARKLGHTSTETTTRHYLNES